MQRQMNPKSQISNLRFQISNQMYSDLYHSEIRDLRSAIWSQFTFSLVATYSSNVAPLPSFGSNS